MAIDRLIGNQCLYHTRINISSYYRDIKRQEQIELTKELHIITERQHREYQEGQLIAMQDRRHRLVIERLNDTFESDTYWYDCLIDFSRLALWILIPVVIFTIILEIILLQL